jgi:siderophore synthetase component
VTLTTVRSVVADTDAVLRDLDPDLHRRWRYALPAAAETVARRLVAALGREGLACVEGDTMTLTGFGTVAVRRHGFGRAEPTGPLPAPAPALLAGLAGALSRAQGGDLPAELDSAVANLALAHARRPAGSDPFTLATGPDERAVAFELLATDGHNLHPCGRTRLGWSVRDVLAHDLEARSVPVHFVGLRREHLLGDDVGARLDRPGTPGYAAHPVHPWQLAHLRATRADLFAAGALVDLPDVAPLPAAPTAALRTLYAPGHGYLKLSLDIQVTSTRRTISTASTRNGRALTGLLTDLLGGEAVFLLAEPAGGAARELAADRDLAAIHRTGLAGRLADDEVAVPAAALTALLPNGRSVARELLRRVGGSATAFVVAYARLLLPPLLRLVTRHGIAVEAHLQNCLPVFSTGGAPRRLALRDLAGLRVHPGRLAARGHRLALWPGSVIVTTDPDALRAKLAYTSLQAHLGELVRHFAVAELLDESTTWRAIRSIVDNVYDDLRADNPHAAADHAFFTAPTVAHKALVRMRLGGAGDRYVPVDNPLHRP